MAAARRGNRCWRAAETLRRVAQVSARVLIIRQPIASAAECAVCLLRFVLRRPSSANNRREISLRRTEQPGRASCAMESPAGRTADKSGTLGGKNSIGDNSGSNDNQTRREEYKFSSAIQRPYFTRRSEPGSARPAQPGFAD